MEEIIKIATYIFNSFLHIWPYLLVTIPLAVYVHFSGAAKFMRIALRKRPLIAIFLATVVGAFSPFCSCGVIPVITSLLIGGVPLGPVMSFWIASPSMDPEIFFLSVATLGWKLAIWRLVSTFLISLFSGYITHYLIKVGWLGTDVLRDRPITVSKQRRINLSRYYNIIYQKVSNFLLSRRGEIIVLTGTINQQPGMQNVSCSIKVDPLMADSLTNEPDTSKNCDCQCSQNAERMVGFRQRLWSETLSSTWMVVKFMSLAFFVNALIVFYVPADFLTHLLGGTTNSSILIATLIGIPAYTSNLTALPLISGLLSLGMNPGAALAFLISGPTTTLPAMISVWGIAKPKVFFLYIALILFGALAAGYLFAIFN